MIRFSIFEPFAQSNAKFCVIMKCSRRLVKRDNSYMFYKMLHLMKDSNPKYFDKTYFLKNAMRLLVQPKNLYKKRWKN